MNEAIGWQYCVVELQEKSTTNPTVRLAWNSVSVVNEKLNQLGAEGWELVSSNSMENIWGCTDTVVLWFKRPRRS